MSAQSRVTRLELTADQLLGTDLTPARLPKARKNAPKVITVEELLGPSLTIAGPSSRSSSRTPTRSPPPSRPPRPAPRAVARPPSPRRVARERVTADEVLRTGLPVRTLQAAKARARSGQAIVLTADQLLASGSGGGSGSSSGSSSRLLSTRNRSRPREITAEELAGLGPETRSSSRRPRSAGGNGVGAVSRPSATRSGLEGTRIVRPSTAGATSNGASSSTPANPAASPSGTARGRGPRPGQIQRSSSQGSTRTLPMYTKEPGESEVVIDRGAEELEDETPITVMTPVAEDGPTLANGLPIGGSVYPTPPVSPVSPVFARQTDASDVVRSPSPSAAISPIPIPIIPLRTTSTSPIPYLEEVPSYEAAISMSRSPDMPPSPANIPLPASPVLSPRPPAVSIPGRSSAPSPSSPSSPSSALGSSSPPSPTEGAESPRKRFPFMSLFHSHGGGSSSRSRIRGGSVSGLPPPPASPDRLSPSPPSPRPLHRSSQSASGSMLDLLSRSWSDNHVARPRTDRGGA